MRILSTLLIIFQLIFFWQTNAYSQCNPNSCSTPIPQVNAQDACVLPGPSALDCYYGATTPDAPVSFPPFWCTTIHNNHWFAFTADATTVSFDISCFGCAQGNGIQAAVLSTADCINFNFVSPCLGNIPSQTTQTLTATGLTPGAVYYLCIDGSGGALCDYAINGNVPTVTGTTSGLCIPSSPTGTYMTSTASSWTINPPGAGNFVGSSTGTQVQVAWVQAGAAQVCAQSLSCPNAPVFCLDVLVGEDTETIENVDLCQGKTTTCAGQTFSAAGTFNVNLPSYLDCDSIIKCVVHLIPTAYSTEFVNLCQGQSVTCAGQEFANPGNYQVTLPAYQGCDSIVTCKVNLIPLYISPYYLVNLCGPAEYYMCGNPYTSSGLYSETCTSSLGCDSIVNVNLAILEPLAKIAPPAILDCGANKIITLDGSGSNINNAVGGLTLYKWSGPGIIGADNLSTAQVNQPGNYCLILTHARGGVYCADTACVTVTATSAVPQLPLVSGNPSPCEDSTVIYTATSVGLPPPTSFNWTTPGGIPFTPLSQNSIQITWNGAVMGGPLCVTANNTCGASAPACIPIVVQPAILQPQMAGPNSVCAGGGTYIFTLDSLQPGTTYNWTTPVGAVLSGGGDTVSINFLNANSGPVCVTAQNACGVGAPVCQNVTVSPIPAIDLIGGGEICNGEILNLTFNLSGNAPFDVTWTDGSQNFVLNNITNGHTVPVNPAQTTKYRLIAFNDNTAPVACSVPVADSVTVTVWQHASLSQTAQICEGETILLGGALQNTSGVYVDNFNTIHGCDSIVTTALTVYEIDSLVLSSTTCDPSLAGTTTQILSQTNGCDSIVTSTATLLPSDMTLIFDTNCDLANVGVFTQNLTNVYGCDSTVVTTVTFSLSDTTLLSAASCDPTATGVFTQNLTTIDGCDSLIITTVSLLPSNTTLLSGASCNPANVGVFTQNLSNQFGCDSTVTTTITFFHLDSTFLSAANCDPAATGVFAQTLLTPDGCDSVIITSVSLLPSSTTLLSGTSCNPANVGIFTQNLSNQYGCDSTVTTTITFFHTDSTFLSAANCDPAATGVFSQTLVTPDGCDSVIITNVALLPSSQTAIQSSTCDPSAAGIFTYNLFNQFGCDSTVTETVALLPSNTTFLTFNTCDPTQTGTLTTILLNQWGCDSTVIAVTSLLPPSSCGVSANLVGSNILCDNNTGALTLTATLGEPPFNYTILLSGAPVNTGTLNAVGVPQTVSGLAAGNYTLDINSVNGFSTTAQAMIVQLVPPTLSVSVVSDYSGYAVSCTGEMDGSAKAIASGDAPPFSFLWSNGSTTQQINNIGAGNYNVVVTDATGCTTTASVALDEPTPLIFSFTVNDLDCFGQNDGAIFAEASGGAAPYKYALDNGSFQTSNAFFGLDAGSYKVTVLDANHCQRSEVIGVNALIPLVVELGDNQTIELGENTTLQALVNYPLDSILSVKWTPPFDTTECPECLTQIITPLVSTAYSVQVTALNGCSDDDKIIILVDRRKHLYVPNIFSPNSDGANDKFSIFAKSGTVRTIKTLQVFDRWGEALYEWYDFMPNDPTIGWEGDFRGQKMTPGVYVWYIEVEFIDGAVEIYKGDVTLMR